MVLASFNIFHILCFSPATFSFLFNPDAHRSSANHHNSIIKNQESLSVQQEEYLLTLLSNAHCIRPIVNHQSSDQHSEESAFVLATIFFATAISYLVASADHIVCICKLLANLVLKVLLFGYTMLNSTSFLKTWLKNVALKAFQWS